MRILICALILIVNQNIWGQTITEDQLKVKRERDFRGEALYGFMNGGSELFLEYGFNNLKALEIEYRGEDFSIEIYQMGSPENAFGIYSQHTFRCNPADEKFSFDCSSPGQFQVASGDIYLSVVSEKRGEGYQQAAFELAELFINKFSSKEYLNFPQFVTQYKTVGEKHSNSVKFAKGPIALSNSLSEYMSLFENVKSYKVWIVSNNGEITAASVYFSSADEMAIFLSNCRENGKDIIVENNPSENLCLILNFPAAFLEGSK